MLTLLAVFLVLRLNASGVERVVRSVPLGKVFVRRVVGDPFCRPSNTPRSESAASPHRSVFMLAQVHAGAGLGGRDSCPWLDEVGNDGRESLESRDESNVVTAMTLGY